MSSGSCTKSRTILYTAWRRRQAGSMSHEQMLSTRQVAGRLGMTVRTVYRWEKAGRLHPVRLPTGQRRFPGSEVAALLHAKARAVPRCAAYTRASRGKQAKTGNFDRQREWLVAAVAERGVKLATAVTKRASPSRRLPSARNDVGMPGPKARWRGLERLEMLQAIWIASHPGPRVSRIYPNPKFAPRHVT